jgi:8-oxo-dGTP diphosphatase
MYSYPFPKADNTVDIIIYRINPELYEWDKEAYIQHCGVEVLLIRRGDKPGQVFPNCLAIPGGFINMDETLKQSACRELKEETGVESENLRQVGTYGDPGRDPRGRVISTVFCAKVPFDTKAVAADDAAPGSAVWLPLHSKWKEMELAFDHAKILTDFANS